VTGVTGVTDKHNNTHNAHTGTDACAYMHMLRKNQEKPVTVTERVNVEHIGQEFEPGRRWPGTRSTSSKPVTNAKLNSSQIAEMCTNVQKNGGYLLEPAGPYVRRGETQVGTADADPPSRRPSSESKIGLAFRFDHAVTDPVH